MSNLDISKIPHISKVISILRDASGLSKKELARRSELSPSFESLIESGKRAPSTESLRRIEQTLGLPSGMLLFVAAAKTHGRVDDSAISLKSKRAEEILTSLSKINVEMNTITNLMK